MKGIDRIDTIYKIYKIRPNTFRSLLKIIFLIFGFSLESC